MTAFCHLFQVDWGCWGRKLLEDIKPGSFYTSEVLCKYLEQDFERSLIISSVALQQQLPFPTTSPCEAGSWTMMVIKSRVWKSFANMFIQSQNIKAKDNDTTTSVQTPNQARAPRAAALSHTYTVTHNVFISRFIIPAIKLPVKIVFPRCVSGSNKVILGWDKRTVEWDETRGIPVYIFGDAGAFPM